MLFFITEWSFGIVNVRTDEQWPKSPRRPFATFQAGFSRGDIAQCDESGEPHAESPFVDPDRIRGCCWPACRPSQHSNLGPATMSLCPCEMCTGRSISFSTRRTGDRAHGVGKISSPLLCARWRSHVLPGPGAGAKERKGTRWLSS
jgi:hypothetical protein